jgi:hypothetical protein
MGIINRDGNRDLVEAVVDPEKITNGGINLNFD